MATSSRQKTPISTKTRGTAAPAAARPMPGLCFVRKISTVEQYPGSQIIVPEQARDKIVEAQWEIVSVGAPEPCDDEDCERWHHHVAGPGGMVNEDHWMEHPCDLAPGDWVLTRKRSVVPSPQPELYIVRQDDCIGRFVEAP